MNRKKEDKRWQTVLKESKKAANRNRKRATPLPIYNPLQTLTHLLLHSVGEPANEHSPKTVAKKPSERWKGAR